MSKHSFHKYVGQASNEQDFVGLDLMSLNTNASSTGENAENVSRKLNKPD